MPLFLAGCAQDFKHLTFVACLCLPAVCDLSPLAPLLARPAAVHNNFFHTTGVCKSGRAGANNTWDLFPLQNAASGWSRSPCYDTTVLLVRISRSCASRFVLIFLFPSRKKSVVRRVVSSSFSLSSEVFECARPAASTTQPCPTTPVHKAGSWLAQPVQHNRENQ